MVDNAAEDREACARLVLHLFGSAMFDHDVSFLLSAWAFELAAACGYALNANVLSTLLAAGRWKRMGWKRTERAIARLLDGRRVGPTGEASPDVVNAWVSVEVKHRRALPKWLIAAVCQAVANARRDTLPIVVLHQEGQRHRDDLVLCRLGDFMAWFGDGTALAESHGAETANIDET